MQSGFIKHPEAMPFTSDQDQYLTCLNMIK